MPHNPLEQVPQTLTDAPRWLGWRHGPLMKNGKRKKEPICVRGGHPLRGQVCDGNRPENWTTVKEALEFVRDNSADGVGFAVTESDDLLFVDLDNCVDAATGEVARWAAEIAEEFRGAYLEVSPSGTGLHVFCRGRIPVEFAQGKRDDVEVYAAGHYATVTGRVLGVPGAVTEKQAALNDLLERYDFRDSNGARKRRGRGASSASAKARPRGKNKPLNLAGSLPEDRDLVGEVRRTALGKRLYEGGDCTGYTSSSEADMALMGLIARHAPDGDRKLAVAQMMRVFRGSALAGELLRKHDEEYYLRRTAETALDNRHLYSPGDGTRKRGGFPLACDDLLLQAVSLPWAGKSGPCDFAVLMSLLLKARERGRPVGNEVRVRLATREHALMAGLARRHTVLDSAARLEGGGWLRCLPQASGWDARGYAIPMFPSIRNGRASDDTCPNHIEHSGGGGVYSSGTRTCQLLGFVCRFRVPSAVSSNPRPLKPLTKLHGLVLAKVLVAGTMSTRELARSTGRRKNSLKARQVTDLVSAGLLIEDGEDNYVVPCDLKERLQREFKSTGVLDAEHLQRGRYEREREARERERAAWRSGPPPPEDEEMAAETLKRLQLEGEALATGSSPVVLELCQAERNGGGGNGA